jgi:hypothetical protein
MRIGLSIVGFLMLIWAAVGKSFRWGLYDFIEGDSDIVLDRPSGRIVAAVIGIAFIIGAILYKGHG